MVGEREINKDYRSEKKDYLYWKKYNPKQKNYLLSVSHGKRNKQERRTVNILLMSFDRELTRKAAPLENHSS